MSVSYFSDQGLVRSHNEDSLHVDEKRGILVVADGMGGHLAGEIASAVAVREIREFLTYKEHIGEQDISEALLRANDEVFSMSRSHLEHAGMGTTVSVVAIGRESLVYGHVGDSRIYLIREAEIRQLTRDHTMVKELVDRGAISAEEAKSHPRKNVLVRALGTDELLVVDCGTVDLTESDTVILMTDGVYGYLDDEEILDMMRAMPLAEATKAIRQRVMDGGASDNLTFIAYQKETR